MASSFFSELKRRNVFKVGAAYAITAWLLIQITGTILPTFDAPDWVNQVFTFFVVLGFPLALILAWAFEMTPEGVKPTKAVSIEKSITHLTGRRFDFAIIALLGVALAYVVVDNYILGDRAAVPVETVAETPAGAEPSTTESIAPEPGAGVRQKLPNSVAVLPFANLSPDPENAYFAAGIHDTILHELSKNEDLNVIARTSMLQYADGQTSIAQVADDLNVETVMEGSVQYAADQVRITAQLIDPDTGAHLWSENYDRPFADIFTIQSEIAASIAEALHAELLPGSETEAAALPTESDAAYALYLKALAPVPNIAPISPPEFYFALNQALALDPQFAEAHAVLAFAYARAIGYSDSIDLAGSVEAHEALIRDHAAAALAIDPGQGLAHAALAMLEASYYRFTEAQAHWERALEVSPNDVEVIDDAIIYLTYANQPDEAERLNNRLSELNPAAPGGAGYYLRLARQDYQGAANVFLELLPTVAPDWVAAPLMYAFAGLAMAATGQAASAAEILRPSEQASVNHPHSLAGTAYAYALAGMPEDAERIAQRIHNISVDTRRPAHIPTLSWVYTHLATGDTEAALESLNELVDNLGPAAGSMEEIWTIEQNIWQDPILDRPEFVEARNRLTAARE